MSGLDRGIPRPPSSTERKPVQGGSVQSEAPALAISHNLAQPTGTVSQRTALPGDGLSQGEQLNIEDSPTLTSSKPETIATEELRSGEPKAGPPLQSPIAGAAKRKAAKRKAAPISSSSPNRSKRKSLPSDTSATRTSSEKAVCGSTPAKPSSRENFDVLSIYDRCYRLYL
jgi:hypothetical protein